MGLDQQDSTIEEYAGRVINGDALTVLKNLPTHSVDAIVTDPP